jgi:ABC-type sugar transport system ATPase subunit
VSLLSAAGLSKSFPGVRALEAVDFELLPGEVHALLGENGAGKSTLIKVFGGAVVPDGGEARLEGEPLPLGDPLAVRRRGINIVYQELTLVPELTAAENIFLGRERGRPFLRRKDMTRSAQALLDQLGARISPAVPVRTLSVAQQQLVEIARALANESKVLILDEPSATVSDPEVERLFAVLRRLRERGLGIVYISHRLEEIFAVADRVTVLRDGRRVASAPVPGVDRPQLIRWMVGRDVTEEFPPRAPTPGDTVLEVRSLACPPRFSDVSLTVRRGEIVGLAGLVGAGRTSAALALFGALPQARGEVRLDGRPVHFASPAEAIDSGVGYVTEDRRRRGLFRRLSAAANITISYLRLFARRGLLSLGREWDAAAAAAREFDVRAANLGQSAGTLSGGNQQKLLLARLLLKPRKLLILDEPTRGIDVGAKAEIYALMNRLTAQGLGILMISSELTEILGMSDRVVVMHEGRTAGELSRAQATPEAVMELAIPLTLPSPPEEERGN